VALGKQKLSLPTFVRSSQLNTLAATYAAKRKQQAWPKTKATFYSALRARNKKKKMKMGKTGKMGGSAQRKMERKSFRTPRSACLSQPLLCLVGSRPAQALSLAGHIILAYPSLTTHIQRALGNVNVTFIQLPLQCFSLAAAPIRAIVCVCLCSDLNATDKVALRAPAGGERYVGGGGLNVLGAELWGPATVASCIIIRSALVIATQFGSVRGATQKRNWLKIIKQNKFRDYKVFRAIT